MTLTKAIVYAVAADAHARAIRQGQSKEQANDAYYEEFDRLFAMIGGPDGWIDLPAR